jgi:hypothetical protein
VGSADNLPRWDGQRRGWQESWYILLHDPRSRAAFWLRYSMMSPLEGPAFAGVWAIEFRPDAPPVAARQVLAVGEFSADPFEFRMKFGAGTLVADRATGRITGPLRADWDLSFKPAAIGYDPTPPLLRAFTPFSLSIPNPRTRFTGTLRIADRTYALDGAPGCQGHFASPSLGEGWTWGHATEFEEGPGFAEAVAPATGLAASVGFAWRGRSWAGNTVSMIPAGRCEGTDWKRTFRAETESGPVTWEIEADPARTVGLEYRDPAGSAHYVYCSLLASSTLRAGDVSVRSRGTTVMEISQVLPRLDVPLALRAPEAPAAIHQTH